MSWLVHCVCYHLSFSSNRFLLIPTSFCHTKGSSSIQITRESSTKTIHVDSLEADGVSFVANAVERGLVCVLTSYVIYGRSVSSLRLANHPSSVGVL